MVHLHLTNHHGILIITSSCLPIVRPILGVAAWRSGSVVGLDQRS